MYTVQHVFIYTRSGTEEQVTELKDLLQGIRDLIADQKDEEKARDEEIRAKELHRLKALETLRNSKK